LTFLKLGGSLITDKAREATPRPERLRRLATEVRTALDARPEMALLIGHGSGSFGHFVGRRHSTRAGVHNTQGWTGYALVSAAAARLNRLVADAFLEAGVPVLSLQPSASAVCADGQLQSMSLRAIETALAQGLLPLVYGDVALDNARGGTIVSTEEIFLYLAPILRPERILLAGEVLGVLGPAGDLIPHLRPNQLDSLPAQLGDSYGVDVTGGMLSKVIAMLELVAAQPTVTVRIFSGKQAGTLVRALADPDYAVGTLLAA
jgi:isopentenyl phosphate kinase